MPPVRLPLQKRIKRLLPQSIFAKSLACLGVFFGAAYGSSSAIGAIRTPADDLILSVTTRLNPDYDPQGIRFQDLTLYPFISAGTNYTDNVYAQDRGEVGDYIYTLKSGVAVKSDFIRHALDASISAERGLYNKYSSENYTDYTASLSGRIDVTGQTAIPLSLSYQHEHYDRDTPEDFAGASPTEFDLWTGTTGIIHNGRSFAMKLIATFRDYAYRDNETNAGVKIDNSTRDYTEWSLYSSVGMPEEGYFAPFIYNEVVKVDYDKALDANGFNRDSDGYEIGAGSIINFSRVTRASFNLGYISRSASDSALSDIDGLAYGFNLVWEPSTLAAFILSGERSISETIQPGSQGSIGNSIGLTVNYELFPNLFFKPTVNYMTAEYEGIDRTIDRASAGLDMTYKMNQNLWLTGGYRYITQEEKGSRPDQDDFNNNTFNLALKLQF